MRPELSAERFTEMMDRLADYEKVHVIVSNAATTVEAFGQFGGFSTMGPFFNVQTKTLDMHIRPEQIAAVFAVEKPGHLDGVTTLRSASRNYYIRGPRVALGQALMLTGDQGFVEPLRRQIDNLYAVKKVENGRILLPNKHGDDGWYGYRASEHFDVQRDIYLWSMRPADMERIKDDPWISYLEGRNPGYPWKALQSELARVRGKVKGLREDQSTPDSRGSDYSQRFNPVAVTALVNLTLGGNHPGSAGNVLHSRLRYFDPVQRRAGLPKDVGALVSKITNDGVVVKLVNTSQTEARRDKPSGIDILH